jgi:ornithine cyclodeaminase
MLLVGEEAAKRLVTMTDALAAVSSAFADLERGEAEVFPVVTGHGSSPSSGFAVKSGLLQRQRRLGFKIGTYWPDNRQKGLASHGSTVLLLDDDTGLPHALVSATYLTALRTAAADGVAALHLARPDSSVVGMVGAGHQAWFELLALREVRPIRKVLVWSRSNERAEAYCSRAREELSLEAERLPLAAVVEGADILVTVTAAREPLVKRKWVKPGTHISAMGADAPGKQELDVALVAAGALFADSVQQSITIGEYEAAEQFGTLSRDAIRTLGSVILERNPGRRTSEEITIFDSSGMSLQDLAIGAVAIERAVAAGLAQTVAL